MGHKACINQRPVSDEACEGKYLSITGLLGGNIFNMSDVEVQRMPTIKETEAEYNIYATDDRIVKKYYQVH